MSWHCQQQDFIRLQKPVSVLLNFCRNKWRCVLYIAPPLKRNSCSVHLKTIYQNPLLAWPSSFPKGRDLIYPSMEPEDIYFIQNTKWTAYLVGFIASKQPHKYFLPHIAHGNSCLEGIQPCYIAKCCTHWSENGAVLLSVPSWDVYTYHLSPYQLQQILMDHIVW